MKTLEDKARWLAAVRGIVTFKYLDGLELAALVESADILACEEGETIVTEGETTPWFFGILEGTVSVNVKEGGGDVYVCALGEGDVFGEAGIFVKVRRTASVKAAGDATLIRLHRDAISKFIRTMPAAGNKVLLPIIYGLLRKLRMVNQELAYERKSDLSQDDVDAMVNGLLADPDR